MCPVSLCVLYELRPRAKLREFTAGRKRTRYVAVNPIFMSMFINFVEAIDEPPWPLIVFYLHLQLRRTVLV